MRDILCHVLRESAVTWPEFSRGSPVTWHNNAVTCPQKEFWSRYGTQNAATFYVPKSNHSHSIFASNRIRKTFLSILRICVFQIRLNKKRWLIVHIFLQSLNGHFVPHYFTLCRITHRQQSPMQLKTCNTSMHTLTITAKLKHKSAIDFRLSVSGSLTHASCGNFTPVWVRLQAV